jgi:hypothetical protein
MYYYPSPPVHSTPGVVSPGAHAAADPMMTHPVAAPFPYYNTPMPLYEPSVTVVTAPVYEVPLAGQNPMMMMGTRSVMHTVAPGIPANGVVDQSQNPNGTNNNNTPGTGTN